MREVIWGLIVLNPLGKLCYFSLADPPYNFLVNETPVGKERNNELIIGRGLT